MSEELELFAEKAHDVWAKWMDHFLTRYCDMYNVIDETHIRIVIPTVDIKRWKRQVTLRYKDLTEEEKESDRKVAKEVFIDE